MRNMDIPVLRRVRIVMREIERAEERQRWQRERLYSVQTTHFTGLPGGGVPHGLEDAIAILADLDEKYADRIRTYRRELTAAEKILSGIEPTSMRTFCAMLYVDGAEAQEVMRTVGMSRRGFERAKRAVEEAPAMRRVVWREHLFLRQTPEPETT